MALGQETLRVGVIGCGRVAQRRHLPALQGLKEARVVALADIDEKRLNALGDRFQVENRYVDYRALLEQPDIEAVGVLASTECLVEIALAALDAGKHVLIEKPMALSLNDGERLLERANASSKKALIGYNMRWHRLVLQAREIIEQGTLGEIKSVRSAFTHWRPWSDAPHWKRRRAHGGGGLMNEAVHHYDLWRFLLGTEVESISVLSCSTEQYDDETCTTMARMSDGVPITGVVSLKTSADNEIEIYGEGGRLAISAYRFDGLEFYEPQTYAGDIGHRLRGMAGSVTQLPGLVARRGLDGDYGASFLAEWRHFVDVIHHDGAPGCTVSDGLSALQVALAALYSTSTGQAVEVARAPRQIAPLVRSTAPEGQEGGDS